MLLFNYKTLGKMCLFVSTESCSKCLENLLHSNILSSTFCSVCCRFWGTTQRYNFNPPEFFKSPAPSAWYALALEKESRSIGPQGPELWPFKNGNFQTISFNFEPSGQISSIHVQTRITLVWNEIFQKFKSLASSAWCALALGTISRTIASLGSKLWSFKEGTCQRICDPFMFKRS